jgi:hypothetical protein
MTQLNEVAFLVCTFASTFEYIMHTHVQLLYADGTVCIEILLTSTFIFCGYDPLQTLALQDLQHFPAIEIRMPPSKPKPSEIAVEAKKSYIPYIRTNFSAQWPSTSYLCHSESVKSPPGNAALRDNPRFGISYKYIYLREDCSFLTAFYDRDPVDLALDWSDPSDGQQNPPLKPVVVIMPANEKRPGGDWEAGTRINHTRRKRDLSLPI